MYLQQSNNKVSTFPAAHTRLKQHACGLVMGMLDLDDKTGRTGHMVQSGSHQFPEPVVLMAIRSISGQTQNISYTHAFALQHVTQLRGSQTWMPHAAACVSMGTLLNTR